jgi:hypothetical protein
MSMTLCHRSSIPYRSNKNDEKMTSSILLPPHCLLVICLANIWLWFLHIGFKVIVYDYSYTYSHLRLVVIDFVVAKDTIPFSVTLFLLPPNCRYMSLWYPHVKLSPILHPKTMLHILHLSQMMCYMPWLRNPHTSPTLTFLPSNQTQKKLPFFSCYEWPPLL